MKEINGKPGPPSTFRFGFTPRPCPSADCLDRRLSQAHLTGVTFFLPAAGFSIAARHSSIAAFMTQFQGLLPNRSGIIENPVCELSLYRHNQLRWNCL